eukprot:m.79311 g.79311  ORF g.79311 m.79311 type:complete len:485 (+) comp13277_c0_seq2:185-1639(+)
MWAYTELSLFPARMSVAEQAAKDFLDSLLAASDFDSTSESDAVSVQPRTKRTRYTRPRQNPLLSSLAMYLDEEGPWAKPDTLEAQEFRRDFRVPFAIYLYLRDLLKANDAFSKDGKPDAMGRVSAPLELKLLSALNILGRGTVYRELVRSTGMSETVIRDFFSRFIDFVSGPLYPTFVHMPQTKEEFLDMTAEFRQAGLPGCAGSMDCVHVLYDMAPAQHRHLYTGKEKHPTIAFNVIVNHRREIMSVSNGFPGATNDKTIVRFDDTVTQIRTGNFFPSLEYQLHSADGSLITCKGPWLLVDGGYHRWRCLQGPDSTACGLDSRTFSAWAESIRKDSECTFGILKKRWVILKNALRKHRPEEVSKIFRACCVLHNILLRHDGLNEVWQKGRAWTGPNDMSDLEEIEDVFETLVGEGESSECEELFEMQDPEGKALDHSAAPAAAGGTAACVAEVDKGYETFRQLLATHITFLLAKKKLVWPSRT